MRKYTTHYLPAEASLKLADDHQKLRKGLKLSQIVFAEKSGISLGSLKRFEQTGQISLQSFLKLLHFHNRLDDFATLLEERFDQQNIEQLFSDKTRKK